MRLRSIIALLFLAVLGQLSISQGYQSSNLRRSGNVAGGAGLLDDAPTAATLDGGGTRSRGKGKNGLRII